jgi:hypothetical protein
MKLTLILFFTMAYSVLAKNVAIRVVLNHQGQCSEGDIITIQSDIMNIVRPYQDRRVLRQRRLDPWYCASVCRNFPKGTCWLAYPLCTSFRREMTQSDNALPPSDSLPDASSAADMKECKELKGKISDFIQSEMAWSVAISSVCESFLQGNVDLKCFKVKDE